MLPPTQEMTHDASPGPEPAPDRATSRHGGSVRRMRRAAPVAIALALFAAACGDDGPPTATPLQADAIGTVIDAELATDEQRCILEELIATGIEPQTIIDGTVSGEEDAELLAMAVSCVDDLASVPAFVQTFMDASAEAGTPFTQTEAICVIGKLGDDDPVSAAADCIAATDGDPDGAIENYGDDTTLDLLWDACDGGNNQACDELYLSAPLDTVYLEFARTCANQLPDSIGLRCFLDLG